MTNGSSRLKPLFGEKAPYASAKMMPLPKYRSIPPTMIHSMEPVNGH